MKLLETYKALADESRLRLLALLTLGSFNVQELTELLGIGQSTVSHHLRILTKAGLTVLHREGTWSFYTLSSHAKKGSPRSLLAPVEALRKSEPRPEGRADPEDPAEPFLSGAENMEFISTVKQDYNNALRIIEHRRHSGKKFFDSVVHQWRDIRQEAQGSDHGLQRLIELVPGHGTCLDLGCGTGEFLERIADRVGKVIGVDYSQGMLDQARRNLGERANGVDFRLGYLEHLPVGDQSVDIAVAHMVLHHLSSPPVALHEVARVLRQKGRLMIVDLLKHEDYKMQEQYADLWLGFELEQMSAWCQEAGFDIDSVQILGEEKEIFLLGVVRK